MRIVLSYVKIRNYVIGIMLCGAHSLFKVRMIQIEKYDRYSSALTPCCGVCLNNESHIEVKEKLRSLSSPTVLRWWKLQIKARRKWSDCHHSNCCNAQRLRYGRKSGLSSYHVTQWPGSFAERCLPHPKPNHRHLFNREELIVFLLIRICTPRTHGNMWWV